MVRRGAWATRAAPATTLPSAIEVGEMASDASDAELGEVDRAANAALTGAATAAEPTSAEWPEVGKPAQPGPAQPAELAADGANAEATLGVVAGEVGVAVARVGYAPIVRVDTERREIELCATSEAVDSHGTIFDYEASKAAFLRWLGNVREMHERRAVGTRVAVRCDDAARKIFVRLRISRGAQDTWEKVLDGTLRGASIGATGVVWRRQRRRVAGQERTLDVATAYELAELSLVDNPSNPDALGVTFVRDATPDLALLDALAPDLSPEGRGENEQHGRGEAIERAQGPFSPNREGYPDVGVPEEAEARPTAALDLPGLTPPADGAANARERFHDATRALLLGCGCLLCQAALAAFGSQADAGEASDVEGADDMAARHNDGGERRLIEAAQTRMVTLGLRASAERLAAVDVALREVAAATKALTERLTETQGETAGEVGELRGRVAALEAQPAPGGPAAYPTAYPTARPVEKTHPLAAHGAQAARGAHGGVGGLRSAAVVAASGWPGATSEPVSAEEQCRALESLAGRLRDPQAQIAVAAELIRLRQG